LPLPLLEYSIFKLQFMPQFIHNHLPISFSNIKSKNVERRAATNIPLLRNDDNFFVPLARLTSIESHLSNSFQEYGMTFLIKSSNQLPQTCFQHNS
jgi:hypothetical protein